MVWHNDDGGYYCAMMDGLDAHAFRWHKSLRPGVHIVTTRKAALDDGRPAQLVRSFDAVVDDFGDLVEVAA